MKHLPVIAVAVAVAVPTVAVVSAEGQSAHAGRIKVVRADFKTTGLKMVDAAPPGESPGDLGVLAGKLFAHGGSKQIGRYQGLCYTMAPKGNSQCTFTFSLAGGQITLIAAYGKGFNGSKVVHEAVVGGTGAYRDARGEGIGVETSDTTGTETIRLIR